MDTMRERFTSVTADLLDRDNRISLVLADIGAGNFTESKCLHPERVINVGIREQLMIGVSSGLALEGFRPIAHSYAPFTVERPFEQLKLDLGHQGVGAILVSVGASFDWTQGGHTHHSPGDVALLATLPDWNIFVPGHPDEAESALRSAALTDAPTYVRLSELQNRLPIPGSTEGLVTVRDEPPGSAVVVAVGPMLDPTLEATRNMNVTVAYTARPFPLDSVNLAGVVARDVIYVEPYLRGTSAQAVTDALSTRAVRLLSLGVGRGELRRYGTVAEHNAAWGLDAAGLRASINTFLEQSSIPA